MFQDGAINWVRSLPPYRKRRAVANLCPWCDLHHNHDRRVTRMIESEKAGLKVGTGPGRADCGFEINKGPPRVKDKVNKTNQAPVVFLCAVM